MTERRSLVEGIKPPPPPVDSKREMEFVYAGKQAEERTKSASPPRANLARVPISTRIRADFAGALKRASLERQLHGTEPNTLQDILEEAIEPWLKSNGYVIK